MTTVYLIVTLAAIQPSGKRLISHGKFYDVA